MSGRVVETIGNLRGNIEFARENIAKHWDERKFLRTSPLPLEAKNILSQVSFTESDKLIDNHGILYVINGKPEDKPEVAREYWLAKGMPETEVRKLVDGGARIKLHIQPREYKSLIGQKPLKAAMDTIDAIAPLYDNNAYPLDASIPGVDGFNAHQRPHIRTVTHGAYDLLKQAQALGFRHITRNDLIVATRGAAWHDSANIVSRRLHARGGPRIMENVVPASKQDPLLERVQAVIVFHNEPELRELLKEHTNGSAQQGIEYLSQLDPAILATILADKLHIGQDRLPAKWTQSEGILRDWNIGVNAAFTTESAGFVGKKRSGIRRGLEDMGKFVVNIKYNETIEDEYFTPRLGHNLTQDSSRYPNGRIDLPEAIQSHIPNATHSEVLEAMLWKTYSERLRLTIMSVFAFNPHAESVEINIFDPDANRGLTKHLAHLLSPKDLEKRIQEVTHRQYLFTRDNIDEKLQEIAQSFERKGVDLDALKKAGQQLQTSAPAA